MNTATLFRSLRAASFFIGLRKSKNEDGVRFDLLVVFIVVDVGVTFANAQLKVRE
jgi:hypothetical protein